MNPTPKRTTETAAPPARPSPAASPALNSAGRRIDEADGFYLVSNPATGALSALSLAEMLAFERLESGADASAAAALFRTMGQDEAGAARSVAHLLQRLERDGWMRRALPATGKRPLDAVYLTITRECNLACPYCYQGLAGRRHKTMALADMTRLLDAIVAVNDCAHIIVTGGEPMLHPDFFAVLDALAARGLSFSLLTNGVYLDEAAARRLKGYTGLERVQISIDGIEPATHALSRGPKSFAATRAAVERVAAHGLPFLVAPTIHDGNADEVLALARWALELGGSISANDLRHLPYDMNPDLTLGTETLQRVRRDLATLLTSVARGDAQTGARLARLGTRACSSDPVNARFVCGVAYSLIDIDWNGDVFPCHMLKGEALRLGNAFTDPFAVIFERGEQRGWRTPSHAVDGCRSCAFVSTCAGGCRAKTYHAFGTPAGRSPTCAENGQQVVRRLLQGRRRPSPAPAVTDAAHD